MRGGRSMHVAGEGAERVISSKLGGEMGRERQTGTSQLVLLERIQAAEGSGHTQIRNP